ncbi:DUF3247 family protein [Novilysobacter erysipheiresistens]|uniref:DUF3247 family protein n=1 Tax=Novilysobacter erysipheiresistens TaxID=1749332 RepID=A0ABU7YZZ4_9GAMM
MTRNAEHVHVDPAEVARIRELIEQLPNGARVVLQMADGGPLEGIVAARPVAQLFFGPDGSEGTNAVLRLEQPAMDAPEAAGWRDVWVDRIRAVRRLDPAD